MNPNLQSTMLPPSPYLERPIDLIARGELGKLKEVLTDAFMAAHGG